MKSIYTPILLIVFSCFIGNNKGHSQSKNLEYSVALSANVSSQKTLPFWQTANQFGTIPNSDNIIVNTTIFSNFNNPTSLFDFSYKASVTGSIAESNDVLINELYGSVSYKNLLLDVGVKHQDILWEGLSSSNGNIAMSTNARSLPGYNLHLIKYVKLPFAKKWLTIKGNYGDYLLNDNRIVDNARLHTKSIYFKSKLSSKTELITGLNHYVQWGGTSSLRGKQPSSFKDYLRIVTGSSGGSDALLGDQINALGNTLGSYLVQFNYKGEKTNWNFYWSHPFEDRSGRELTNYPDALYGLFVDLKKPNSIVSKLLTEVYYIRNNSGDAPHYRDEEGIWHAASGRDNYFNNGVYNSGWTYFGNTLGSPYFTATPLNEEEISNGIILGDNRFIAINIGWAGIIHNIKYKTMLSHITYVGWFDNEYSPKPQQFSGLLEINLPQSQSLPFEVSIGTAFDTGTYRPVNFGGFLKLTKKGNL